MISQPPVTLTGKKYYSNPYAYTSKLQEKTEYNKADQKHGLSYHYYPNGKISKKLQYSYGKKQGLSVSYYINGNVYQTIQYSNGMKNGYFNTYHKNGKMIQ